MQSFIFCRLQVIYGCLAGKNVALTYRKGEIMDFYSGPARFNSRYGETALTPLEEALTRTIDAIRRKPEKAKFRISIHNQK